MDAYSLGQILREAREANEITIEEAVAALRIRQPFLEAFEAGEFEIAGVPEIQVRGMLRIYGRFLELEEEDVLQLYDQMRLAMEKGGAAGGVGGGGGKKRRRSARSARPSRCRKCSWRSAVLPLAAACCGLMLLLLFSAAAIAIIAYVTIELVGIENHHRARRSSRSDRPAADSDREPGADGSGCQRADCFQSGAIWRQRHLGQRLDDAAQLVERRGGWHRAIQWHRDARDACWSTTR